MSPRPTPRRRSSAAVQQEPEAVTITAFDEETVNDEIKAEADASVAVGTKDTTAMIDTSSRMISLCLCRMNPL
jgi:hypothetical protein